MVFMSSGGKSHEAINASHWLDQKQPLFTRPNYSENTNWENVAVKMSVAKEAAIKATGRFNAPLEFWGCTKSPRYHVEIFHTYSNPPKNMYPDVAECEKS